MICLAECCVEVLPAVRATLVFRPRLAEMASKIVERLEASAAPRRALLVGVHARLAEF